MVGKMMVSSITRTYIILYASMVGEIKLLNFQLPEVVGQNNHKRASDWVRKYLPKGSLVITCLSFEVFTSLEPEYLTGDREIVSELAAAAELTTTEEEFESMADLLKEDNDFSGSVKIDASID